jgi:hypothetical protein
LQHEGHSALGPAHAEDEGDAQDAGQPDRLATGDGALFLQRLQLEFIPLVEQQGRQQLLLRGVKPGMSMLSMMAACCGAFLYSMHRPISCSRAA